MSWMITHTGQEHTLSGPMVLHNTISINDIAHALAIVNRFTGHTNRPYSVAEHSLLCADMARHDSKSALVQLCCLLHDAHEVYTGDVSSPAKQAIGFQWTAFEAVHADAVRRAMGLHTAFTAHRELVNRYDLIALATERRDLTSYDTRCNAPWPILDTPGAEVLPVDWVNLNEWCASTTTWNTWRDIFLTRYFDLTRQVQASADALMAGGGADHAI